MKHTRRVKRQRRIKNKRRKTFRGGSRIPMPSFTRYASKDEEMEALDRFTGRIITDNYSLLSTILRVNIVLQNKNLRKELLRLISEIPDNSSDPENAIIQFLKSKAINHIINFERTRS